MSVGLRKESVKGDKVWGSIKRQKIYLSMAGKRDFKTSE